MIHAIKNALAQHVPSILTFISMAQRVTLSQCFQKTTTMFDDFNENVLNISIVCFCLVVAWPTNAKSAVAVPMGILVFSAPAKSDFLLLIIVYQKRKWEH
jgi:hypothetical protein